MKQLTMRKKNIHREEISKVLQQNEKLFLLILLF